MNGGKAVNSCGTIYGVSLDQLQELAGLLLEINGYYDQLIGKAPDQEQAKLLQRLATENAVNVTRIGDLYLAITCNKLKIPPVKPPVAMDYLKGLSKVRTLEAEVLPRFVKMYLAAPNIYYTAQFTSIRGIIAYLAGIPFMHGSLLQYLITKNLSRLSESEPDELICEPMRENAGGYTRADHQQLENDSRIQKA